MTVWTITLRPDVEFHDGSPLTADVVAGRTSRPCRPRPSPARRVAPITSVTRRATSPSSSRATSPWWPSPTTWPPRSATSSPCPSSTSQELTRPRRHRALQVRVVGAERPLHRGAQPALLARRAALPRQRHLQAHRLGPVPGGSLRSGTIDLMVSRDPGRHPRPAARPSYQQVTDLTRSSASRTWTSSPQHRRRPHQRPHRAPGPGLRHRPDEIVEAVRRGRRHAQHSLFPPGSLYRAGRQRLPHLRPDQGQAARGPGRPEPRRDHRASPWSTITDPRQARDHPGRRQHVEAAGFKVTLSQVEQVTYIDNLVTGQVPGRRRRAVRRPRPRPQLRLAEPHHRQRAHRPQLRPQQGPAHRGGPADRAGPTSDQSARVEAYQDGGQAPGRGPALPVDLAGAVVAHGQATRCRTSTTSTLPDGHAGPGVRRRRLHPTPDLA